MKSLVIVSLNGISSRVHRRAVVAMATLSLVAVGCAQGSIGDRCNPDLAAGEYECNSGLMCSPAGTLCPESYCCYPDGGGPSPFCEPGCNGGANAICSAETAQGVDPSTVPACVWLGDAGSS
jgi:hypothetical protein